MVRFCHFFQLGDDDNHIVGINWGIELYKDFLCQFRYTGIVGVVYPRYYTGPDLRQVVQTFSIVFFGYFKHYMYNIEKRTVFVNGPF